ncbi:NAD(P)-binding domain-containing protein [Caulobacter segnis]
MLPAGVVTDETIEEIAGFASPGDIIIDGGNSFYKDDIRRAKALRAKNLHYVDVGTSGGVWGLERGYCMMIGGDKAAWSTSWTRSSRPWPRAMATSRAPRAATPPTDRAERGYIHAGPAEPGTSSRWSTTASSTA